MIKAVHPINPRFAVAVIKLKSHMKPFIHETAVVLGDVILGDDVSVWPTAVIRGDVERIIIGARSNVQDGAVIHADPGVPTNIGEDCVIGHRAIVHGSTIEDGVLIGMGAILLNGTVVGTGSIIGAGSLCTQGMIIPPGSLVLGVPAKVIRTVNEVERARTLDNAARYVQYSREHASGVIRRHKMD